MKQNISLQDISDGKLYTSNDLVRADAGDCEGCHACCCGTGGAIVLDPLDVYRLTKGLSKPFTELMASHFEAGLVDGIVLPNLRNDGEEQRCTFLNEEGRCSVHAIRPGICRLFPLARYYENNTFHYILQTNQCTKKNLAKVKVKNWIDTPNLPAYERFVIEWHELLKALQAHLAENPADAQAVSMFVLRTFYMQPYDTEADFYEQFEERLEMTKESFGVE